MSEFLIRKIKKQDNPQIESIIRSVFFELNIPLQGTAFEDPETSKMYEAYSGPRSIYYVLEHQGEILGGAGIKPLKSFDDSVCELQKMYSLPKIRGRGFGQKLLNRCLESAQKFRFERCYIETIESLRNAVILYKRNGFLPIGGPMGNTGHHNCGLWMLKKLQ